MPDLLAPFQQASKQAAQAVISKAPATANQLQETYQQHFPSQKVSTMLTNARDDKFLLQNTSCEQAIQATLDATEFALDSFGSVEQYIQLTVPKVEDGGNFGVTVQLAAIKVISDQREKLEKGVEDLYKYYSSRADALEKCKIPGKSTTKSTTEATSESTGNDSEKGDSKSSSTSKSTESKTTESSSESADVELRKQALAAVDVRFYTKAKSLFQTTLGGYMAVMDFMDKNKEKISKPKGDGGSRGYSGSMY